jgi:hypothetical protein
VHPVVDQEDQVISPQGIPCLQSPGKRWFHTNLLCGQINRRGEAVFGNYLNLR